FLCLASFLILTIPSTTVLPSSPTRRSSDLCFRIRASFSFETINIFKYGHEHNHTGGPAKFQAGTPHRDGETPVSKPNYTHAQVRSEEHTSELQSHLNLVCRLLLEKKTSNDK